MLFRTCTLLRNSFLFLCTLMMTARQTKATAAISARIMPMETAAAVVAETALFSSEASVVVMSLSVPVVL